MDSLADQFEKSSSNCVANWIFVKMAHEMRRLFRFPQGWMHNCPLQKQRSRNPGGFFGTQKGAQKKARRPVWKLWQEIHGMLKKGPILWEYLLTMPKIFLVLSYFDCLFKTGVKLLGLWELVSLTLLLLLGSNMLSESSDEIFYLVSFAKHVTLKLRVKSILGSLSGFFRFLRLVRVTWTTAMDFARP